jgi:hypothetical protein
MASSPKIDDLRKKFEENPRRYFAPLANEYRKAGDIEQAIAICREYLPQQPGHMSGHIVFGQALYEARQLDEAKTVFETALSLDPENLIALRHLGDISLMAGDTEAAKTWYNRVLEADPRNEETQAQLASIEKAGAPATPAATPAPPAPPAPVESLSTAKTTPLQVGKPAASSAPTVVMKAFSPPVKPVVHAAPATPAPPPPAAPVAAATADSATTEIRLDGLMASEPPATTPSPGHVDLPATLVMESPHGITPVAKHDEPAVTQTIGLETTSMAGAGAPSMDSFSLDGLETTSLSAPPPVAETPAVAELPTLDFGAPAGAAEAMAAAASADLPMLDLDLPAAAPAAATASVTSEPAAIDLDFGAPAAVSSSPAPVSEPPVIDIADIVVPEPSVPAVLEMAIEVPVSAPAAPEPLAEIDLGLAAPPDTPAEHAAVGEPLPALDIEQPAAAPESGPFVTETMAELYLQQGHRDEALRVYRALLDQKPADAALRAKVATLEAPPVSTAVTEAPAALAAEGPSIREVLVLIAQRRPGYHPEASGTGAIHIEPAAADVSYAAPEPTSVAASRWAADALGALWGHAEPAPAEESAALMLATAFADLNGMDSGGTPGLDLSAAAAAASAAPAVAVPAPTAPPSSFSFDKFFSQRVTAEHASTAVGPTAQPESKEDVAQFTRWLEGLKQQ